MIVEALRVLSTWFQDGAEGVNAKLPDVPRVGGDAEPPAVVTFVEESSHGLTALKQAIEDPAALPALAIVQLGDLNVAAQVQTSNGGPQDGTVDLGVWYVGPNLDTAEGRRDALYTMRAVRRSLRQLMKPANVASRTLNTVTMKEAAQVAQQPPFTVLEDIHVTAAVRLSVELRDTDPD